MKTVIAVYRADNNSAPFQYLLKSEVRLLNQLMKDFGPMRIELVQITPEKYRRMFGKG